jgi:hypothetical protein
MGKPDALSRQADHGSGQGDNNNLTLLAPELFRIHTLAGARLEGARLEGDEHNILWEVQRSLRDGVQEAVAKAARELWKDKGRGTVKSAEWSESDGLLMFRGKIYVPNDRDLRRRIIEQHHDTRIAGHAGRFKTLELVFRSIGGHRCPATSASTSRPATCATRLSYNIDDPLGSSTPRRLLRHHGT